MQIKLTLTRPYCSQKLEVLVRSLENPDPNSDTPMFAFIVSHFDPLEGAFGTLTIKNTFGYIAIEDDYIVRCLHMNGLSDMYPTTLFLSKMLNTVLDKNNIVCDVKFDGVYVRRGLRTRQYFNASRCNRWQPTIIGDLDWDYQNRREMVLSGRVPSIKSDLLNKEQCPREEV